MGLVLSRRGGESVQIGDAIRIDVIEIVGNKVRLNITCPREITIVRTELLTAERQAVESQKRKE